jgi:exonuclease-1
MGINTLLPTLKPTFKSYETLENLRGQTAAIDIMVWLYKGAYSCSYELATG